MISSNTIPVNATPAELVERVVGELRRSGAVVVLAKSRPIDASLIRAAETMDFWPPPYFDHPGVGAISLAVAGRRATVLRLSGPAADAMRLDFDRPITPDFLHRIIGPNADEYNRDYLQTKANRSGHVF